MAIRVPINLGQPQTTLGFRTPPYLPAPPQIPERRVPQRGALWAGASAGASGTPTVESGHWLEALAAALEGGIHGRDAYHQRMRDDDLLARELTRQTVQDKRDERRDELETQTLERALAGEDVERWSEPFELGGAQVQRSERTNQLRSVVSPPGIGMIPMQWGPLAPEAQSQYPGLNPGDVQQNRVTGEIRQIPGAQQRARATERQQRAVQSALSSLQQGERVLTFVRRARDQANGMTTGFIGGATRGIQGTPAFNLDRTLDTIKANLGFEALQQMRQESPTGGALGQVAVIELQMLQAVQASLDNAQNEEQLRFALGQVEAYLTGRAERMQRMLEAYGEDFGAPFEATEARGAGSVAGDIAGAAASAANAAQAPPVGTVEDGFRFRGGDPANPNNWEPVR